MFTHARNGSSNPIPPSLLTTITSSSSVWQFCDIRLLHFIFFKPEERAMRMVASLLDPNHSLSMLTWVRHPHFVHNCRNWRFKVNLNNLYGFSVKRKYLSSLEGIPSSSTKEEFEKELISKRRFCVMMFQVHFCSKTSHFMKGVVQMND